MKRGDPLSPRELQVVTLLAQGKNQTQMSMALGISPGTVGVHVMRARKKLGAPNSLALATKVVSLGIVTLKVRNPQRDKDDDNS